MFHIFINNLLIMLKISKYFHHIEKKRLKTPTYLQKILMSAIFHPPSTFQQIRLSNLEIVRPIYHTHTHTQKKTINSIRPTQESIGELAKMHRAEI